MPEHPKDGGLVAVLPGADASARPILLLAHTDVVEAKRADWRRDPFKLVEEIGFFYARGASDDKAVASIFTGSMVRLKGEPTLRRTIKLALTCGEETSGAFNGAQWLPENRRRLIDAQVALNQGGGGRLGKDGRPLELSMQVAEKTAQDYTLETWNPGGHSSMPRPDNAIYELAAALEKVHAYTFPIHMNPTTTAFFKATGQLPNEPQAMAQAMTAISANPNDQLANMVLSRDPCSTLRSAPPA